MSRHALPARLSWKDTEPVRLYLYGVLGPLVALLVALGVIQADQALLWLAVGAALLGVPAVERARALVDSPATRAARVDGFTPHPVPDYDDLDDGRA